MCVWKWNNMQHAPPSSADMAWGGLNGNMLSSGGRCATAQEPTAASAATKASKEMTRFWREGKDRRVRGVVGTGAHAGAHHDVL